MRSTFTVVFAAAIALSACTAPCRDGSPFTVSPVDLTELAYIVPMGALNPPSHTLPTLHMYWNYQKPGSQDVAVVAPADLTIARVKRAQYFNRAYELDYTVEFNVCGAVTGYFSHLTALSSRLLGALGKFGGCSTRSTADETLSECSASNPVAVKAGEEIGRGGNVESIAGFDFGVRDGEVHNDFVNPTRMENALHAAPAFNYFSSELKAQIGPRLGHADGSRRTAEPLGGGVAHDSKAYVQGNWFKVGGTGFVEGYAVALVPDNVRPEVLAFSIGQVGTAQDNRVLYFQPKANSAVRAPFAEVNTADAVFCYDALHRNRLLTQAVENTMVLLQPQSDGKLKLDVQTAADCSGGPHALSAAAITLER